MNYKSGSANVHNKGVSYTLGDYIKNKEMDNEL